MAKWDLMLGKRFVYTQPISGHNGRILIPLPNYKYFGNAGLVCSWTYASYAIAKCYWLNLLCVCIQLGAEYKRLNICKYCYRKTRVFKYILQYCAVIHTEKRAANIMMTHVKHIFKPHFQSTQPVINLWYMFNVYIILIGSSVCGAEAHFRFIYIFFL